MTTSFCIHHCFHTSIPNLSFSVVSVVVALSFLFAGGGGCPQPLMVTVPSRKVMVVVDPAPHSTAALQYALSLASVERDELILFHIENPNTWKNTIFSTFLRRPSAIAPANAVADGRASTADVDFLDQMKRACEIVQAQNPVRIVKTDMDGKDNKATVILSKIKALGIDLIIIGQRRSLSSAILGYTWSGGSMIGSKLKDTADSLIENSPCNSVGVQKKGQNAGFVQLRCKQLQSSAI